MLVAARRGTRRRALSLEAVYPTVAQEREALEKGVAPSSSKFLKIRADESPDEDLKVMNLLASAAPDSDMVSDDDPALGKVSDTVEVEEAVSETTMSPLERVVTEEVLADPADGNVEGSLFVCYNKESLDVMRCDAM